MLVWGGSHDDCICYAERRQRLREVWCGCGGAGLSLGIRAAGVNRLGFLVGLIRQEFFPECYSGGDSDFGLQLAQG